MSRLDSFIRRLDAQRLCLAWAVTASREVAGAALEVGLGNGRTYDHLRELLAGSRPIFALDRALNAHPDCAPDAAHLLLGEFRDTLPRIAARLGRGVAIVHADTGSGDTAASRDQGRWLPGALDPLLAAGAVVASDQDMAPAAALGWEAQPAPDGAAPGRYFLYRKRA